MKNTVATFRKAKEDGKKLSMLTAYDYSTASLLDAAGIKGILVGDSLGNVILGYEDTISVTMEDMIHHGAAVARGAKNALVVVDMPFGTCSGNPRMSLEAAIRIMKETGADSLKIEGGKEVVEDIKKIIDAGIPVMGHLGLMPQSINKYGTYTVRAKEKAEADKLLEDAKLLEEAGCYGIVLEKIPAKLAQKVAQSLSIPVIGIGAGGYVDGQVLVMHDMLGISQGFSPRFLRRYADINGIATAAVQQYIKDVKSKDFPNESEQY